MSQVELPRLDNYLLRPPHMAAFAHDYFRTPYPVFGRGHAPDKHFISTISPEHSCSRSLHLRIPYHAQQASDFAYKPQHARSNSSSSLPTALLPDDNRFSAVACSASTSPGTAPDHTRRSSTHQENTSFNKSQYMETLATSPNLQAHLISDPRSYERQNILPAFKADSPPRSGSSLIAKNEYSLPPVRQLMDVALSETSPRASDLKRRSSSLEDFPILSTLSSSHQTSPYKPSDQSSFAFPALRLSPTLPFTLADHVNASHAPLLRANTAPESFAAGVPSMLHFPRKRTSTESSDGSNPRPQVRHSASSSASISHASTVFSGESASSVCTQLSPPMERSCSAEEICSPSTTPTGASSTASMPPGGFRCNFVGCTAAPFQTQYLLKCVSTLDVSPHGVMLTDLSSHANVHSQARPHYCPVTGCPRAAGGKGFKRKNEMIRHGLVHDSPGYVCPYCPADREHRYPRPDNLQR